MCICLTHKIEELQEEMEEDREGERRTLTPFEY